MEDYKKKYKEAVARMQKAYKDNRCTIGFMGEIFPEFKESDDERIRRAFIGLINLEPITSFNDTFGGFSKEQVLFWLEKQRQKSIWHDEDDEKILKEVISNYESGYLPSVEKRDEIIEKLKSIKDRVQPKQDQ